MCNNNACSICAGFIKRILNNLKFELFSFHFQTLKPFHFRHLKQMLLHPKLEFLDLESMLEQLRFSASDPLLFGSFRTLMKNSPQHIEPEVRTNDCISGTRAYIVVRFDLFPENRSAPDN